MSDTGLNTPDTPLERSGVPTFSQVDAFEITYLRHTCKRLVATVLPLMQEKENAERANDVVGHVTYRGTEELWAGEMRKLTDEQLDVQLGNVVADLALADKYEHNAPLRPAIRRRFDQLTAEKARRAPAMEQP